MANYRNLQWCKSYVETGERHEKYRSNNTKFHGDHNNTTTVFFLIIFFTVTLFISWNHIRGYLTSTYASNNSGGKCDKVTMYVARSLTDATMLLISHFVIMLSYAFT